MNWEPVIGLEVHVQLRTESKMFCACPNRFGAEPNTLVCPVCLALPGSLPVLNRRAVEFALRLGLALGSTISHRSRFARKNYFYPDLPKNYQITQYDEPILSGGSLDIGTSAEGRLIDIERAHLEEDTGKSVHPENLRSERHTRVDFNRAGVPLLEVVSCPVLASPREAFLYLTRLRQIVRVLEITDGDMEKGSLRCDANLSLRRVGEKRLGTKTEIKNLNSIRSVERGLEAEIRRQQELLDAGVEVEQCTLLYDADKDIVAVMRSKESAHDYRYFPEPDLPPVVVEDREIESTRERMPELPAERTARFERQYSLPAYDAGVLTSDYQIADYFESVVRIGAKAKTASNWVMGEVLRTLKERGESLEELSRRIPSARLAALLDLMERGLLSGSLAKDVFHKLLTEEGEPEEVARAHGLIQESDRDVLLSVVTDVLNSNPGPVADLLAGKEKAFGFLLGQLMRATKGRANPQVARRLLEEAIERRRVGE